MAAHNRGATPRTVLIIGGGVQGLACAEWLTQYASRNARAIKIVLAASQWGDGTTSRSGGWVMPFLCDDPRVAAWARYSTTYWRDKFGMDNPSLSRFVQAMPSLVVSRHDEVRLPDGHPGVPEDVDPSDFGLNYYKSGVYLDQGVVISTCGLLPVWSDRLFSTSVQFLRTRVLTMLEIAALAEEIGADVVVLAVGGGSFKLLDDTQVQGVEGVLLHGPALPGRSIHNRMAIMDEDDDSELTYTFPHVGCPGHGLVVGGSGDLFEQMRDLLDGAGQRTLNRSQRLVAKEIRRRVAARMPDMADWEPFEQWVGYRPWRRTIRIQMLPSEMTYGIPMITAYGTGGSGWTVAPGIAEEIFRSLGFRENEDEGETATDSGSWTGC